MYTLWNALVSTFRFQQTLLFGLIRNNSKRYTRREVVASIQSNEILYREIRAIFLSVTLSLPLSLPLSRNELCHYFTRYVHGYRGACLQWLELVIKNLSKQRTCTFFYTFIIVSIGHVCYHYLRIIVKGKDPREFSTRQWWNNDSKVFFCIFIVFNS